MTLRRIHRCINCRYPRTGLPEDAACPECGEPAPAEGVIVLFGASSEAAAAGNFLSAGIVLLATSLVLFAVAATLRNFGPVAPGTAALIGATILLVRAHRSTPTAAAGGDLIWIIKPDAVEIRGALVKHHWRWDEIENALFAFGWRKGAVLLSLVQPSVGMAPEVNIWVNERDVDARAVHALLRERIRAARSHPKQLESPQASAKPTSPRASPPPAPS
jgi:hypothetical protein